MSRRSLVTGANRGLGLEFVRQLLARGERVLATVREPARADALQALAAGYPEQLRIAALDVADADALPAFAAGLPEEFATLELLINNAGMLVSGERFGSVRAQDLDATLRTNTVAPFLLTQALAPRLAAGARVLNVSSWLGSMAGSTRFGTPSYCVSKAALNMVTMQLGHALRERDIAVFAFDPGWVRTDMGGERAPLTPAESVQAMLATLERLTLADSGGFFERTGERKPW
ncbi:MAG TPA: SDR family oxidoreductase [Lysobacter sp.]|nr:SDR family oxidoreductase [Lysobacter sp.]